MEKKSIYKVPNGKLLKISFSFNEKNNSFNSIQILGDFFCHPESGIEEIEKFLKGKKIDDMLVSSLEKFLKENGIELYGFASKDLLQAIQTAFEN